MMTKKFLTSAVVGTLVALAIGTASTASVNEARSRRGIDWYSHTTTLKLHPLTKA